MRNPSATPGLSEVMTNAIDYFLRNVHTSMPGIITKYDQSTGLANVQPALNRKYKSEDSAIALPIISNVPVAMPRAGNALIKVPLQVGDSVLLIFSERSIDRWLENGGTVDPQDSIMFALNDAVAIPSLFAKTDPPKPNTAATSVEISNGTAHVEVDQDGTIKMVADNATVEIDQAGNATITATKITLESSNVNLGDEAGSALAKLSDLATLQVIGVQPGGATIPVTNTAVGTTKVKAT
jgi:hypothetical protein